MRTTITHQNLCWIPIVGQETKDSSCKDGREDCNRILAHTPTKNSDKYSSNAHDPPSKPIRPIDPVHCIHHTHHPEPSKENSRYGQQTYLRTINKDGNNCLLI